MCLCCALHSAHAEAEGEARPLTGDVRAEDPEDPEALLHPEGEPREAEPVKSPSDYWKHQSVRAFLAVDVAIGAFNRVRVQAGYGRPNWSWMGVLAEGASTTEFGAVLGAVRADFLAVNLQLDVRGTWSYVRRQPALAAVYADADFTASGAPANHYGSFDAFIWGYVPVGPTLGYWEVGSVLLLHDVEERATFEEYIRLTMNGRFAAMVRAAYWLRLVERRLFVGPAADFVVSPERDILVRVGASASYQFTPHLGLSALWTVPVVGPDPDLDWFTQSWGILRLTWCWATGEPRPGW